MPRFVVYLVSVGLEDPSDPEGLPKRIAFTSEGVEGIEVSILRASQTLEVCLGADLEEPACRVGSTMALSRTPTSASTRWVVTLANATPGVTAVTDVEIAFSASTAAIEFDDVRLGGVRAQNGLVIRFSPNATGVVEFVASWQTVAGYLLQVLDLTSSTHVYSDTSDGTTSLVASVPVEVGRSYQLSLQPPGGAFEEVVFNGVIAVP